MWSGRRKEQFRAAVCGEKSFIALFFNFIRSRVARVQTNDAAAVMGYSGQTFRSGGHALGGVFVGAAHSHHDAGDEN